MIKNKKVLIIPDAYTRTDSGAEVANVAAQLILELGCTVGVFSDDILNDNLLNEIKLFHRAPYVGSSNWIEKKYERQFKKVLTKFNPDTIFFIGSITNKNLCYFRIANKKKIKTISKIFMQDFFCVKYYAYDNDGPCTKCLEKSYINSYVKKCIIKKPVDYIKTLNGILIRQRLSILIKKIDYVIGSSEEQLGFLNKFGVQKSNLFKMSLFFNSKRIEVYQKKN